MRDDDSDKSRDKLNFLGDHRLSEASRPMPDCAVAPQATASQVREYVPPRDEVEAGVAEILAGLSAVDRVGVHDNFILLGGESLRAAQAAWQIRNRFGCEVSLRAILAGTVADIAAEIRSANGDPQIQ